MQRVFIAGFALLLFFVSSVAADPARVDLQAEALPKGARARLGSLDAWPGEVSLVAFSPDGKTLAVVIGPSVQFWDVATAKILHRLQIDARAIQRMAFSRDGRFLATYPAQDPAPEMRNPLNPRIPPLPPFDKQPPRGVAIWDAKKGTFIHTLSVGQEARPFSAEEEQFLAEAGIGRWHDVRTQAAPAPDGKRVAWLEYDEVHLSDAAKQHRARPLRGHRSQVNCLAFSPDNSLLASGSRDGTVVLWDLARLKLLTPEAFAKDQLLGRPRVIPPIPPGARIYLILDKKQYFFGEELKAQFVVENAGRSLFSMFIGCDSRGVSRHLRFHVTAKDELGKDVADPGPLGECFGGIGHTPELEPGQKYTEDLPLLRYLRFDKPGTYIVRVAHDLGWVTVDERKVERKPDDPIRLDEIEVPTQAEERRYRERQLQRHPYGEATIKLRPPTPAQVQRRLDELYGKEHDEWDFDVLRDPAYLPALRKRAEQGDSRALAGIAGIATPEATRTLLHLADIAVNKYELAVLQAILDRLPYRGDERQPRWTGFGDDRPEQRRWLVQQAWRPEFRPDLRKLAVRLERSDDARCRRCASAILESLGHRDD